MDDVRTLLNGLLAEFTGGRKTIAPGKHLVEDLGFDSLKMVEMMLALEDRLNVCIPVADAARIHTVGQLYAAVERVVQASAVAPVIAASADAQHSAARS